MVSMAVLLLCGAATWAVDSTRGHRSGGDQASAGPSAPAPAPARTVGVSAWLPYWDDGDGIESLRQHADLLSSIHFAWFSMGPDGSVRTSRPERLDAVRSIARSRGVTQVATISSSLDHSQLRPFLLDAEQRQRHAANVCAFAQLGGYAGIDLNYESFAVRVPAGQIGELARGYVALVGEMARCLHAQGQRLEVTVMARTDDAAVAPYREKLSLGVYDYAGLAAAADVVRPMAYDYHFPGGSPGPVAPSSWLREVAAYGLAKVGAAKLEVGLPTYGYDWGGTSATAITARRAAALRAQAGSAAELVATEDEWRVTYHVDGMAHEVWYEDAAMTRRRSESLGLAGVRAVCLWALGDEEPALWDGGWPHAPVDR